MCDTCVVLSNATRHGEAFFAKNSDREPNEAQYLTVIPAQDYQAGEKLRCTYIEIPQVNHTYQVLLSKPYWMWGAEMGANEYGVVIGNEAIFTKVPAKKEPGLIGMDYLRLALERSGTALEALKTITSLLEQYGQSGNCSAEHGLYYHNSFLITDGKEAYVLETVDKMWIAKKINDFYAISNAPSITTEWDMVSDDLIAFACEHKWCQNTSSFNFAQAYSDFLFTKFSQGCERRCYVMDLLEVHRDKIDLSLMKQILRSHQLHPQDSYPDRTLTAWNVCMHAAPGPIRNSQSVASLITQYRKDGIIHWTTGTSAPCLSVFKPVWLSSGLPDIGPQPGHHFDENCLWWQHERVHRSVLRDFPTRHMLLEPAIADLEKQFQKMVDDLKTSDEQSRFKFTKSAFAMEKEQYSNWLSLLEQTPHQHRNAFYYNKYWQNNNRKAGITV